ncbi:hypothetical protein K493DRAFT_344920 [Basidiobolus meristosporus CBS 931.73]|uniref:Uncharacterized protein n=1 Tax=Basidiobolus meristosporus CBS 931.73 TaxID=1314790 RepID=A0A1Y1Z5Q6_9FUNG|nr:hypothetical protein K493DRAFT_344920 [Basidiobolus meristosporus CBS 931.73]|eukprot:ORY05628.1 hypothetical protein K493DRAFT_344920 [Basidiobolus meristosporus CBS 931.73]
MLEVVKFIQLIERARRKLREQQLADNKEEKGNYSVQDSTTLEILFEKSISSLKQVMVLLEMQKTPFSSSNCMALINLLFPPSSRPFNKNQLELGSLPLKHIVNPRAQLHALLYQVDMEQLKNTGASKKRKASMCFAESEIPTSSELPEPERTLSKTDWTGTFRSVDSYLKRAEKEIRLLDEMLHPTTENHEKATVLEKIAQHYMNNIA